MALCMFVLNVQGQETFTDNTDNGSETWPVPAGVSSVTVQLWGAGGAGGGCQNNNDAGSGGGGGGYTAITLNVLPGQIINYQIGSGGVGDTNDGEDGENSTLSHSNSSTSLTAFGGDGGQQDDSNNIPGGTGGPATGGTTNISGQNGSNGGGTTGGNGGNAGNTSNTGGAGNNNGSGDDGIIPGGGGGGGEQFFGVDQSGGNGGNGQLIITYTINLTPTITNLSATNICEGESLTITGTNFTGATAVTIGGTNVSNYTVNSNTQITATVGSGSTGAVQVTTVGGTASSAQSVTVNTLSGAPTTITGTTSICTVGGTTTLQAQGGSAGTNAQVVWYQNAVGGTPVDTGNSITVSPTTTTTYYARYEGDCNTTTAVSAEVIVAPIAAAGALTTGATTVCQGQTGVVYTIDPITNATSYEWTVPSGATITSTPPYTNSISVNYSASASTGNLTVRGVNSTCPAGQALTQVITVNTLSTAPTAIAVQGGGASAICSGENINLTVSGGTLGTNAEPQWSTDNCSNTSFSNAQSITVNPTTTTTYYVKYVGDCNETACISITVTVGQPLGTPTNLTGTTEVCQGQTNVTYTVDPIANATDYTWQVPTGATITSGANTNSITVNYSTTAVSGNVTVTGSNDECGDSSVASLAVTVNELTVAPTFESPTDVVCDGDSVTYTVTEITDAASYNWTVPTGATITSGNNTNSITVDFSGAVSGDISVSGQNACGSGNTTTLPITVNTIPENAGAISGPNTVCPGDTAVEYSIAAISNASSYVWSISNASATIIESGSDTNAIAINISSTPLSDFIISVVGENDCGVSAVISEFTVNLNQESVAPTTITPTVSNIICEDTSTTLTVSGGSLGTDASIEWFTDSCGGTPAGTGASITVSPTSNTTYFARYTGTCNTTDCAQIDIIIDPKPLAAGTITGTNVVCQGETNVQYSVPSIDYATNYIWTLPPGATIVSGDGTNTILVNYDISASSGAITVQGENDCGTGTLSANYPVTVNITPYIPNNYNETVCSGESFNFTPPNGGGNTVPPGTTYSWTIPTNMNGVTGATSGTNENSFNQTLINQTGSPQTVVYQVTAQTGGCSASVFEILLTINPQPIVSGTPTTQTTCSGAPINTISFTEESGISGAIDFIWSRDNTANVTGTPTSGNSSTINVTLNNTTNTQQTVIFSVTAISENGCESPPFSVEVLVNPTPTVIATPATQTICSEENITEIILSNPNNVTGPVNYSWTRDNNTNITGIANGSGNSITGQLTNTTNTPQTTTFTITAEASDCSSATTTATVTVNPKPILSVNIDEQEVCGNSTIANIVAGSNLSGTSFSWTRNDVTGLSGIPTSGNGATISGTFINNTNTTLTTTFTITGTRNGCSESITSQVNIKPTPLIVATPNTQAICDDDSFSINLSSSNNVSGTTYSWTRDKTSEVTGIAASGAGSPITASLSNNTTTTQTVTFTITATADGCSSTSTATVDVYAPLIAPVISESQAVCFLAAPSLLEITNSNLGGSGNYSYQWQRKITETAAWENIAGATDSSYQPGLVTQNYFYQLIITDECGTVTSNTVFVQVIANIGFTFTLTGIPNTEICPETIFTPGISSVHVGSSAVRYSWTSDSDFISPSSGGPMGNTGPGVPFDWLPLFRTSSANIGPLTVQNNTNETVTTQIRIKPSVYNYADNNPTESDFICDISEQVIDITIRPTPIAYATAAANSICSDSSADIEITGNITDAPMQFSWTRTTPSGITGATNGNSGNIAAGSDYVIDNELTNTTGSPISVTYTITPTSNGCTGTPITYTITVGPTVTSGTIAANQTICNGGDPVAFTQTVAATGSNLSYQWESSTDNVTFTAITGATGVTYDAPSGLTASTWYRRVVSTTVNGFTCSEVPTASIFVAVNTFDPGSVSGNQTICSGDTPTSLGSVNASSSNSGTTFNYNWQSSNSASGPWTDLGVTTATYTPSSLTETTFYQRTVTATLNGTSCEAISTNIIEITINNVDPGAIEGDQLLCGNNPEALTSLSNGTGDGTVSYQWQSSPSGANSWTNITNAINANYDPPAGFSTATDYRRITTSTLNSVTCSAISTTVTVTPNDITPGQIGSNRTVCFGGDPLAFGSTIDASASSTINYIWQISNAPTGPWTDISGTNSSTYDAPATTGTATTYYRRVASTDDGCTVFSNYVSVAVNSITQPVIAGDQNICSTTNPIAFTMPTPATGSGTVQYQWESSTDNSTWSIIPTATSATYDPPVLNTTTYYRVLATSTLNGVSCSELSGTLVVNVTPFIPAIASNESTINDCADTTINLSANLESGISGTWSATPAGGVFSDINNPESTFTGESGETYTLTWTVTNTPCVDNAANVNVTFPDCGNNFDFDGTNTSVSFNDNYNLNNPFSIEIWVKPNGASATQTIISKRNANDLSTGYDLSIVGGSTLAFNWNSNSISVSNVVSTSRWYHVAVTFNGSTYTVYVDGIAVDTATGSAPISNTQNTLLGAMSSNSVPVNYYNGWLDELRIWNTALTETQIREMMNQEIQANGNVVRGSEIPLDINGNLNWNTNLTAYYQMDLDSEISSGVLNPTKGGTQGTLRNMTTLQSETAPIPYISTNNGSWDSASSWLNGTVQQLPNTDGIDWNIVRINNNVQTNRATTVLGLIVNSNTLTINNNQPIEATKYLKIDGTLVLNGESQLLQPENSIVDYTGIGEMHRDQQGTTNFYNYNYWASPVSTTGTANNRTYKLSEVLHVGTTPVGWTPNHDGAPGNPPSISTRWLYLYENYDATVFNWHRIDQNYDINVGLGYIMKGASIADYTFIGQPNNGDYLVSVDAGNDALVGNPYPSAIDVRAFLTDNQSMLDDGSGNNGEVRLWVQSTTNNSHVTSEYLGGYATLNMAGSITAVATDDIAGVGDADSFLPQRYIPVAQGFFITAGQTGNIMFNNGQRFFKTEASGESIFLRTTQETETASIDNELQRVRITFKNPDNAIRELLLGFTPDNAATDGIDFGYDATNFDDLSNDMSFIINNEKYVIQAVGAFDNTKQFPLGIFLSDNGNIEISLKALENFDSEIDVFIYDAYNDTYTQINNSKYQMHLDKGDYTDRYFLAFKDDNKLDIIESDLSQIKVNYLDNTEEIHIKTPKYTTIKQVYLINTLGQTVKTWNATNAPLSYNCKIPVQRVSEGSYIIKVETENGTTTKKIIIQY